MGPRSAFLELAQRADVAAILDEIETAGLTLKAVWDDFRSKFDATACVSKSLSDAITDLVKTRSHVINT